MLGVDDEGAATLNFATLQQGGTKRKIIIIKKKEREREREREHLQLIRSSTIITTITIFPKTPRSENQLYSP